MVLDVALVLTATLYVAVAEEVVEALAEDVPPVFLITEPLAVVLTEVVLVPFTSAEPSGTLRALHVIAEVAVVEALLEIFLSQVAEVDELADTVAEASCTVPVE